MKKYIGPVLSLASVGLLFYLVYNQKGQIKELKTTLSTQTQKIKTVDSLGKVIDSMENELFIEHTNAERYSIAADRLYEMDSLAGIEFDECLNSTE